MPDTNVNSPLFIGGKSDAERHGLTPARRETNIELFYRWAHEVGGDVNAYERARRAGEVTYNPRR